MTLTPDDWESALPEGSAADLVEILVRMDPSVTADAAMDAARAILDILQRDLRGLQFTWVAIDVDITSDGSINSTVWLPEPVQPEGGGESGDSSVLDLDDPVDPVEPEPVDPVEEPGEGEGEDSETHTGWCNGESGPVCLFDEEGNCVGGPCSDPCIIKPVPSYVINEYFLEFYSSYQTQLQNFANIYSYRGYGY